VILTAFSEELGKVRGMVRGGRKKAGALQPGNLLRIDWRRRLSTQLGTMTVEVLDVPAARCFDDEVRLTCLQYLAGMLDISLADEEVHPTLYRHTLAFISDINKQCLWERLGFYELQLLLSLGYGLSLDKETAVPCEQHTELMYVSPKSGRAVSRAVGEPYRDKLLPLPSLFGGSDKDNKTGTPADLLDVFRLTGHFLDKAVHGQCLDERRKLIALGRETGFSN